VVLLGATWPTGEFEIFTWATGSPAMAQRRREAVMGRRWYL